MVAKSIFKYDLWNPETREEDNITVHCFMPNGNYIFLQCPGIMTLLQMKEVSSEDIKIPKISHLRFFSSEKQANSEISSKNDDSPTLCTKIIIVLQW